MLFLELVRKYFTLEHDDTISREATPRSLHVTVKYDDIREGMPEVLPCEYKDAVIPELSLSLSIHHTPHFAPP